MTKIPAQTKDSFGGCTFACVSPAYGTLASSTKVVNVVLSFEEALKLNLAIQEAVRDLNTLHRAVKVNKLAGMKLAIHMDKHRITVARGRMSVD